MLGSPPRAREPLHLLWIAGALTLAAFLGGALGLLWHAASGDDETVAAPAGAEEEAAGEE